MRLVAYLFITTLLGFANLLASESLVNIAYPKNNSLHRETSINIVLDVNTSGVNKIKAITPKGEIIIDIIESKSTYCRSLFLRLGENRITVRAYKDDVMVDEKVSKIFVSSEIHHEHRYPPIIYKQTFFHTQAKEAQCVKCHDMTSNEIEGVAFIDVKESNCYQCHNSITVDKFAHAPAVNWLCTSCHNGETGSANAKYAGASKYIVAEPVNRACFKCHKDNFKKWKAKRYRHEPLDSGNCNKCHNPHASPYSMFVRKPVDKICLGCHKDKHLKSTRKLVSDCVGTSQKEKCIDCHTPHASSKPFFIKEESDKKKKKDK
jgi:predicted CXXCH cytochrome family protein